MSFDLDYVKLIHIPNGGSRNKVEAINFKKIGVLSGVLDLLLLADNITVFFEVKSEKGTLSDNQKEFIEFLTVVNIPHYVVKSVDEFKDIIEKKYPNLLKKKYSGSLVLALKKMLLEGLPNEFSLSDATNKGIELGLSESQVINFLTSKKIFTCISKNKYIKL